MRTEFRDMPTDSTASIGACLVLFVLVAGLACFGGYWLMQPRVIPNMGLAAYVPPPGTRLIPLPHKMDAPELKDLPPAPVASAEPDPPPASVEKPTVAASPKPVAKRPRARAHPADDPAYAYAYSDRWGYRERSGYGDRWGHGDRWGDSWSSWRGGGRW